jgi:general L-amino acid transport system substrate-binding protein
MAPKITAALTAFLIGLSLMGSVVRPALAGPTLEAIKARGELRCGVSHGLVGFSQLDAQGRWTGIDADFCRAVAAAVVGDGAKVRFLPFNAQQRFSALQSGEIDVLARNTTWTLSRDTALGLNFAGVIFYDGQGFLVAKRAKVKQVRDLSGASICVQQGTSTELNLADHFRANALRFKAVVFQDLAEAEKAFFEGRCDAFTADNSALQSIRAAKAGNPDDYLVLPELISKEPLGPAVRQGDEQWFDIVKWVLFALIEAEEVGVTSANLEARKKSPDPNLQRLLGVTAGMGGNLGLSDDWAARAIAATGNYGEIFERNVGQSSGLKLERGHNALWKDGGLLYAMPFR